MPRVPRRNCLNNSKIYHAILKGVNGQEIFFEDSDRVKFLEQLKDKKELYQYEIYAYVLMSNHVHLILFDKDDKITDTNFILSLFSEDKIKAIEMFIQYNKQSDEEYGIEEFEIRKNLTDEEAVDRIKKVLNIENVLSILNVNRKIRDKYIKEIADINGITYKQIARILGISKRTIQRAVSCRE